MTELQKDIVTKLLLGYNIAGNRRYGYRLRSPEHMVCRKFSRKTFDSIKDVLRQHKGLFVVNKTKVRQLHGNSFFKKEYKAISKKIPALQEPGSSPEKFF